MKPLLLQAILFLLYLYETYLFGFLLLFDDMASIGCRCGGGGGLFLFSACLCILFVIAGVAVVVVAVGMMDCGLGFGARGRGSLVCGDGHGRV